MGRRGPKSQPAAIAKQKGYYRESRHGDELAKQSEGLEFVYNGIPTAPATLSEDGANLWNYQLMNAQKIYGYISFLDLKLFETYCYVYQEMEALKKESITRSYTDANGVIRLNPLYKQLTAYIKDFTRLSQLFGFDPSSRSNIKLEQKKEDIKDEFEDVL